MKIIFDYNRTLFNPDSGMLFPNVFRVLKVLAPKHELFLVTLDKPERKTSTAIEELRPFFNQIFFVERKTATLFAQIVNGSEQPERAIVIGDRLEDEIAIGQQLGLVTVHVCQQSRPKFSKITPTHTVSEIKKVIELIKQYEE